MIMGGEIDGRSNQARKRTIRSARAAAHQAMKVDLDQEEEAEISFGPRDKRNLATPHADALICSTEVAGCLVHRMFVDTGSAVNILYQDCLIAMDIKADLKPATGSLYGFSGEAVTPIGTIELPVTIGSPALRKTRMVEFTVMDLPNLAYNGILGRPALVAFGAVVSMTHLKMKFPVRGQVGKIYGDQVSSKECYVKAVTKQAHNKKTKATQEAGRIVKHKKIEAFVVARANLPKKNHTTGPGTETSERKAISTGESCMSIELLPGKTGYTTRIGSDLPTKLQQEIAACLRRNTDVFAFGTEDLKGVERETAEHRLNEDPNVRPVKQKLRHFGAKKDQAIREQVAGLLKAGHIREVQYLVWISNAVMIAKKDKKWRMCVDFRDLNAACPKDHYPLPRIDQLVDSTSGCQLLSMMDAYQGYHQIKMHKEDVPKMVFAVCCGAYGYVSMPFGLKNAGATYQKMMDGIFDNLIGRNVAVYVDDMIVKSRTTDSHVADLEEAFGVMRKHRFMLNPAKCSFGVQTGRFLGYEVTPRGIEVN